MDKLRFMKPWTENFRNFMNPNRYMVQPRFEDKVLREGAEFKHSWKNLAHMHDMRIWTLTYAPSYKNNIRRLQEVHLLNQEMWYGVYRALWTRLLVCVPLWFFLTRIAKDRYMKRANSDSHDACFRDTTAHM